MRLQASCVSFVRLRALCVASGDHVALHAAARARVAAIPAIGLLAGCAAGLLCPDSSLALARDALADGARAGRAGRSRANRRAVLIAAVAVAFAGGGALLVGRRLAARRGGRAAGRLRGRSRASATSGTRVRDR